MKVQLCLLFVMLSAALYAQDPFATDENDMFSEDNTVVKKKEEKIEDHTQKKSLGVSGKINSVLPYYINRDYVNAADNSLDPYMVGDLFLDARLKGGYKGYASGELMYNPKNEKAETYLRELFVDFNIDRSVYFRTGKQVLQWGRCYLWNPNDLINIEKNSFVEDYTQREGSFGIKATKSFSSSLTMYAFVDLNDIEDEEDAAGAYKIEFLVGNTEMAVSTWLKNGSFPVYGYDISTRLLSLDIKAEVSASYGSNTEKLVVENNTLTTERERDTVIPKVCINIGRSFTVNEQPDKVQVNVEFFYNGDGYDDTLLADNERYTYDKDITYRDNDGNELTIPAMPGGTKAVYLLGNDLYEPNYLGRYYGAFFATINNLFLSDIAYSLNCIGNFTDMTFIVINSISYTNINDFTCGLSVNTYLGEKNGEYTYAGRQVDVIATAGIVF